MTNIPGLGTQNSDHREKGAFVIVVITRGRRFNIL